MVLAGLKHASCSARSDTHRFRNCEGTCTVHTAQLAERWAEATMYGFAIWNSNFRILDTT